MPLTSSLSVAASAELTSALDLATGSVPLAVRKAVSLTFGTGAGQADKVFHDRRTLAASATEDLDLTGVLLDAYGAAITNSVVVGAAAATQWATLLNAAGTLTLRPGATFCAMAGEADATGWAVTAGASDLLKVANSGAGTSVTYDIVIIGASA